MHIFERAWVTITYVLSWLTLSPIEAPGLEQHALGGKVEVGSNIFSPNKPSSVQEVQPGPTFKPPTGRVKGRPESDFRCEYPEMVGFEPCSSPRDQGCWLRRSGGDFFEYNIHTDYEDVMLTPKGIDRYYTLEAVDDPNLNADGIIDPWGKVFRDVSPNAENSNPQFPGPWIQACWGDTLHITIKNSMNDNGTSIHWHGIRQLHSMQMDGVNGVTQCPIPPGSSFTYEFRLTQYGSSWYHSHYSVQYADGLQGPLTIHGPSSASFDEARYPWIMTDWGHNSASQAIYAPPNDLLEGTILLNGTGDVTHFGYDNTSSIPPMYTTYFEGPVNGVPRRYLLRLINTSFGTMFTLSIDNHTLQVISADFVPIEPYITHSVNIAIGQRYNVIVIADQYANKQTDFWIRTQIAPCADGVQHGIPGVYEKTGIVRYNSSSTALPTSSAWDDVTPTCADETPLIPMVHWTIGKSANADGQGLGIQLGAGDNSPSYVLADFAFKPEFPSAVSPYSFQVNYSDPTFLDFERNTPWPDPMVVIPENFTEQDWVYIVLDNPARPPQIQHPIHLHGHDFAILKVSNTSFDPAELSTGCPENKDLHCENPPRRDVVLVPYSKDGGHVIIAFRTDNPGSWLMHCHIAFHASKGLALQFLERLPDLQKLFPPWSPPQQAAAQLCADWIPWWDGRLAQGQVQDDSGI